MFNCSHCNNGFCRKYSTLDVDFPCSGNGDCDGYEVVDEIGFPHWATEAAYNNGYAKGVKEFAERIDELTVHTIGDDYMVWKIKFDNLVKEMVGADNGK